MSFSSVPFVIFERQRRISQGLGSSSLKSVILEQSEESYKIRARPYGNTAYVTAGAITGKILRRADALLWMTQNMKRPPLDDTKYETPSFG